MTNRSIFLTLFLFTACTQTITSYNDPEVVFERKIDPSSSNPIYTTFQLRFFPSDQEVLFSIYRPLLKAFIAMDCPKEQGKEIVKQSSVSIGARREIAINIGDLLPGEKVKAI